MSSEPPYWTVPFTQSVSTAFQNRSVNARLLKVAKGRFIYASGEHEASVFFIERGRVKLLVPSPEGKECLLAIRTAGDIFGELCLTGRFNRMETAIAMTDMVVRKMFYKDFISTLKNESLLEGLIQYLAARIAEQQDVITTMTTVNSEQRLARTLLQLCRCLGRGESATTYIEQRISHEELARMVGTTRTRIGVFLKKFRELGLVRLSGERCFVVEENALKTYIELGYCSEDGDSRSGGLVNSNRLKSQLVKIQHADKEPMGNDNGFQNTPFL
jgi:CRP/FNR family transcriptional regulator, cyclic AMP receptor protein